MAIKAYVGIMGSGKTYEVVTTVILGALRSGRRVVSNIAGLNYDLMRETLIEEGVAESAIGELVNVPHEKIIDPLFWPTDADAKDGRKPFMQLGDVLAVDEIWRFWNGFSPKSEDEEGKAVRRPASVMNFIRMHRQMPHPETGITCDIAVITQDPADMHRNLKGVIEETYMMTKLTAVGMDNRYRVDIFPRTRITRKPQKSLQRSYNKKYFPLYQSHSQKKEGGADVVEVNIDKRGNILTGALFKVVLPIAAIVFILCVVFLWRFFHQSSKSPEVAKAPASQTVPAVSPAAPAPVATPPDASVRAVGYLQLEGGTTVFMDAGAGLYALQNPPAAKFSALTVEVKLPSGAMATSYAAPVKSGLIR